MIISSGLNFGRPAPPGRGSAAGRNFLAPLYYRQRGVRVSLSVFFNLFCFLSLGCSGLVISTGASDGRERFVSGMYCVDGDVKPYTRSLTHSLAVLS